MLFANIGSVVAKVFAAACRMWETQSAALGLSSCGWRATTPDAERTGDDRGSGGTASVPRSVVVRELDAVLPQVIEIWHVFAQELRGSLDPVGKDSRKAELVDQEHDDGGVGLHRGGRSAGHLVKQPEISKHFADAGDAH